MIRETREEAGLVVKPESVKEYGLVHRIQKNRNVSNSPYNPAMFERETLVLEMLIEEDLLSLPRMRRGNIKMRNRREIVPVPQILYCTAVNQ